MGLRKGQINSGSFKKGTIPWNKGKRGIYSEEIRRIMSIAKIGKKLSEETRLKLSLSHKNHPCYKNPERGRLISISKIGTKYKKHKDNPTSFKKGQHINKLTEFKKGERPWNYNMSNEEYKEHFKNGFSGAVIMDKRLEKHPNWLGGKSFEPYSIEFNNRFKNEIRERDNKVCMLCGIHKEKLKRALAVHHINYNKLLSIQENCISLCNSCHNKTTFNRKHWIKFFQSLLSERYNYQYSENQEPILTF